MKTSTEKEKKLDLALSKLKNLNLENPELKNSLENLDNQKPIFDILSGIVVFPIIFYHAKFLEMERWLKE